MLTEYNRLTKTQNTLHSESQAVLQKLALSQQTLQANGNIVKMTKRSFKIKTCIVHLFFLVTIKTIINLAEHHKPCQSDPHLS